MRRCTRCSPPSQVLPVAGTPLPPVRSTSSAIAAIGGSLLGFCWDIISLLPELHSLVSHCTSHPQMYKKRKGGLRQSVMAKRLPSSGTKGTYLGEGGGAVLISRASLFRPNYRQAGNSWELLLPGRDCCCNVRMCCAVRLSCFQTPA